MTHVSKFATHNEYPNDSIEGKDLQHLLHPSTNLAQHQQQGPVVLESAEGVYIRDGHGKQYLEGMAGLWCTSIGYGREELAKVAYEQLKAALQQQGVSDPSEPDWFFCYTTRW